MLLMANLEKVQDKVLFSVLITKLTAVRIFPFFFLFLATKYSGKMHYNLKYIILHKQPKD